MQTRHRARVRAPELVGRGGWIGTGGRELRLADLRGKLVLLDFWTFCCLNCLHVLDELRELEEEFADVLVVVGVHSPKFVHEADHLAVIAAVERYDVAHPVLDDPDLSTWQAYAVKAWPTLALVDPEGYVVAQLSGEGHAHALRRILAELVAEHDAKGTLHRGDGPYVPPPPAATELRFPGKVLALPGGTFLVSDSGNSSLVELAADAETVLRRIGARTRGLVDGGPDDARFSEPQGLCLLPPPVARRAGCDVLVADTVNHALRGVELATGRVRTLVTSEQYDGAPWSPWDVIWDEGAQRAVVALAGTHQVGIFDPLVGALDVVGTSNEGLRDGPLTEAWFAQPSGLAADGGVSWLVDAETSALRRIRAGRVETVIGQGLFDFGHRDGPAAAALLQHPLGVCVLPDGSVAVLDTYNGAVRRYDPATEQVATLATDLAEPSDAVVVAGDLLVVESAAHRLTRLRLPEQAQRVDGHASRTQRPPAEVAPGPLRLEVVFEPPPGQKIDDRYGPATRLLVTATPPQLLRDGEGTGRDLTRDLVLDAEVGDGVLHVAAMAASCDEVGEFPACHVHRQDWGVPVRLVPGGNGRLTLVLQGPAPQA